jgi:hypothetical protein
MQPRKLKLRQQNLLPPNMFCRTLKKTKKDAGHFLWSSKFDFVTQSHNIFLLWTIKDAMMAFVIHPTTSERKLSDGQSADPPHT